MSALPETGHVAGCPLEPPHLNGQEHEQALVHQLEILRGGLRRYADDHIRPGSFLCACIANNFTDAARLADALSWSLARLLVQAIARDVPPSARGSYAAIDAWCTSREKGGAA